MSNLVSRDHTQVVGLMTMSCHSDFLAWLNFLTIPSSLSLCYRNKLDRLFDRFLLPARSDASIDTEETQPCDPSPSQPPSNPSSSQEAPSHPSPSQAQSQPSQAPGNLPPLPPTVSPVSHNWGSGHTMMEGAEGADQEEGEGEVPVQGKRYLVSVRMWHIHREVTTLFLTASVSFHTGFTEVIQVRPIGRHASMILHANEFLVCISQFPRKVFRNNLNSTDMQAGVHLWFCMLMCFISVTCNISRFWYDDYLCTSAMRCNIKNKSWNPSHPPD